MSKVLRSLLVLYAGEDAPRKGGKYAASSKKVVCFDDVIPIVETYP